MSENPKEEIIETAYKKFFGSDTFREAKKLDKSRTLADVKTWFNNKFARKTKQLQNSFIANHAMRNIRWICLSCQQAMVKNTTLDSS